MTLRTLDIFARLCLAVFALLCVAGSATSSLRIHPHSLAYFNEAAGGPENGWRHMLGSNLDWGQDLPFLPEWSSRTASGEPIYLLYYGAFAPASVGMNCRLPRSSSLSPGYYVVSVNFIAGTYWHVWDEGGHPRMAPPDLLRSFRGKMPIGRCGYSIYIFFIDEAAASSASKSYPSVNKVRNVVLSEPRYNS